MYPKSTNAGSAVSTGCSTEIKAPITRTSSPQATRKAPGISRRAPWPIAAVSPVTRTRCTWPGAHSTRSGSTRSHSTAGVSDASIVADPLFRTRSSRVTVSPSLTWPNCRETGSTASSGALTLARTVTAIEPPLVSSLSACGTSRGPSARPEVSTATRTVHVSPLAHCRSSGLALTHGASARTVPRSSPSPAFRITRSRQTVRPAKTVPKSRVRASTSSRGFGRHRVTGRRA